MTIRNVDWMDRALCAQVGPEHFFPTKGESTTPARTICRACPVRRQCDDYAAAEFTTTDDHGIWGGINATQRRKARRATA